MDETLGTDKNIQRTNVVCEEVFLADGNYTATRVKEKVILTSTITLQDILLVRSFPIILL